MSRRKNKIKGSPPASEPPVSSQSAAAIRFGAMQSAALAAIGFAFYFNTAFNGYALDDGLVITENSFTMKGFSGIPGILSNDALAGLPGALGQLTGGRYRPLSTVTFALEQGLFGTNLFVSHLINVLLYCLTVVLLFRLLDEYLFRGKPGLAFLATFIFAVHPVHTEAVANLKGRDELLSLIFLLLSAWFFFGNRTALSLAAFLLALLSKESAITFLAIIPLTSYFFMNAGWKVSIRRMLPYSIAAAAYVLLRFQIVGMPVSYSDEVLNAPFLLARGTEAFCTKIAVLGKYFMLLVFPHPLSYDYSYNQIPYVHVSEIRFLAPLILNAGLLIWAVVLTGSRRIHGYGILFYFASISIVSNFVVDIGAPMGERLLFQPSVGFAIAAGYGLYQFISYRKTLASALSVVLLFAGYKTITRNRDWKDNLTLFSKDVQSAPNSAKAHDNLAVALIKNSEETKDENFKKQRLEEAIAELKRALVIYPSYADGYINTGLAYARLGNLPEAANALDKANSIRPGNRVLHANLLYLSELYLQEGVKVGSTDLGRANQYFEKAVQYNPSNAQALYNLGVVFFLRGDIPKAREYWMKTLQADSSHQGAAAWLEKTGNR